MNSKMGKAASKKEVQDQATTSSSPSEQRDSKQPTTSSAPNVPENVQNVQTSSTEQQQETKSSSPPAAHQYYTNPGQASYHTAYQYHSDPGQASYPATHQYYPQTGQAGYPSANQYNAQTGQPIYPYPPPAQHVVYVNPMSRSLLQAGNTPFEPERDFSQVGQEFYVKTFSDSTIRRVFVRKVYLILTIQLIFTFGVIALFVFEPHVKNFVQTHPFLYLLSLCLFFVVYLALVCSVDVRRNFPWNYISLVIFTLAASYMFGCVSSTYKTEAVLCAVGVCALVCFLVTIFSFYTKFDFTDCWGMICILMIVLIILGIVAVFIQNKIIIFVYGGLGAVVFMLCLASTTQMIMGGKNIEISPEEYIFAALELYVEILYIYMFLLLIFGNTN